MRRDRGRTDLRARTGTSEQLDQRRIAQCLIAARSLAANQKEDWRIGILRSFVHDIGADSFQRGRLMKVDDALCPRLAADTARMVEAGPDRNAPFAVGDVSEMKAEHLARTQSAIVPLHPLDQFRAFQTLRQQGLSEEDIAARFFVGTGVVKQRLKLASVSPKLLDLYAEDEISLEQLMAFAVTDDHARQEQVWESLGRSYNKEPYYIRRQLTEGAVRAADKRAHFVGLDAYQAAGGLITRDLFEDDEGGWLQDPALLDRLVSPTLPTGASISEFCWKNASPIKGR
jgi:hypothetical protein